MIDYSKMYNDLEHELVGLFKTGLTPKSVEIIDDITAAMRNIKKMEYWDSEAGKADAMYHKKKHETEPNEYIEINNEEDSPRKEPYKKRDSIYGFYDDFEEYKSAKEHYRKCKDNNDITGASMWKEVALGNLKSAMAQLDVSLQEMISNTDMEEERVAVKDMVHKLKNKINI